MRREQFEHTIRAAGAILGTDQLLVIGSQAIHASYRRVLPEAERSIETDIAALNDLDGSKADLIDGSIGELSVFQETFGYYAQGVSPKTAILPEGWRKRLVRFCTPATNGVTALCLELHDLWISKAIAGRPKDIEFCRALLKRKLVHRKTLATRLVKVKKLEPAVREVVAGRIKSYSS
ncbi:MAG: hypothetical protein HYT77_10135 [Deltaproteobacteria bacterium]|nr:hypothetical protein [Deltaproteobacteria bacterium]